MARMSNGGVLLILGELCRETILRRTFILKKLISSMAFLMTLLVATICSAESVSDSEVSLGGIPYQASSDYVQSIYGRPSSSSTTYDHPLFPGRVTTWKYGSSSIIIFVNGSVVHVSATANNGFATPAGAYVGMKASVLQSLYGTPTHQEQNKNGRSYAFYRTESSEYVGIRFDCKNGIITDINIGAFD